MVINGNIEHDSPACIVHPAVYTSTQLVQWSWWSCDAPARDRNPLLHDRDPNRDPSRDLNRDPNRDRIHDQPVSWFHLKVEWWMTKIEMRQKDGAGQ